MGINILDGGRTVRRRSTYRYRRRHSAVVKLRLYHQKRRRPKIRTPTKTVSFWIYFGARWIRDSSPIPPNVSAVPPF